MKRKSFVVVAFGLGLGILSSLSCETKPSMRLEPARSSSNEPIENKYILWVENIDNLGAFQFAITYDTAAVAQPRVNLKNFLTSTGREVAAEIGPYLDFDKDKALGRLTYGVVTKGRDNKGSIPGPRTKADTLVTIYFQRRASGEPRLQLQNKLLTDIHGNVKLNQD
ncbi:hypothetical protein L0337_35565 [candidate division KSB1 bacterium]|nr:hypothetical protein [candidate division KSB1 bacterium]